MHACRSGIRAAPFFCPSLLLQRIFARRLFTTGCPRVCTAPFLAHIAYARSTPSPTPLLHMNATRTASRCILRAALTHACRAPVTAVYGHHIAAVCRARTLHDAHWIAQQYDFLSRLSYHHLALYLLAPRAAAILTSASAALYQPLFSHLPTTTHARGTPHAIALDFAARAHLAARVAHRLAPLLWDSCLCHATAAAPPLIRNTHAYTPTPSTRRACTSCCGCAAIVQRA